MSEFVSRAEFEKFKTQVLMTAAEFVSRTEFVSRIDFAKFQSDVSHQLAHLMDDEWDCGDKACPYNVESEPEVEEDAGLGAA